MSIPIKTTMTIQTTIMILSREHGEDDHIQFGEIEVALGPVRVAVISEIENEKVSTFLGDSGLLYGVRFAEYLTGEDDVLYPADRYGNRHESKHRKTMGVEAGRIIESLYEMLYRVHY